MRTITAPRAGISHRANRRIVHCLGARIRVSKNWVTSIASPPRFNEYLIGSNIASEAAASLHFAQTVDVCVIQKR